MTTIRGMGFVPDLLEHADDNARVRPLFFDRTGVSRLPGLNASYAETRDWRPLLDAVQHQLATNLCVAQYVSSAVFLAGAAQGMPIQRPSVMWPYAVARYRDNCGTLEDIGCRPEQMTAGCEKHGLVAEAAWAFNPAEINAPPPFGLDVAAAIAKLTGTYAITSGYTSPEEMRAANDKKHFPGLALDVYQNFDDYRSGVYDEPAGAWLGLHMVTMIGYRPGAILILNSWGGTWGEGGFCWLSDRFVRSHYCKHRTVITAAPAALAA